jgi:hypothetical protein
MTAKAETDLMAPNRLPALGSNIPLVPTATAPWQPAKGWISIVRTATIALIGYWIAIFVGTHLPAAAVPSVTLSDKTLHLLAYAGLAFLLAWAIPHRMGRSGVQALSVLTIVATYAGIDEFSQQFVAGRTASWSDLVADICGCLFGLTLYFCLRFVLVRSKLGMKLIALVSR